MLGTDSSYLLIRRESKIDRSVTVLFADLGAALQNRGTIHDVELQSRDTVHVFSLVYGRELVIAPILAELRMQSRFGSPYYEVTISGQVRAPGDFPLEPGTRVSDLIRAGGDMAEGAYALKAELIRFQVSQGEYRTKQIINIDLRCNFERRYDR